MMIDTTLDHLCGNAKLTLRHQLSEAETGIGYPTRYLELWLDTIVKLEAQIAKLQTENAELKQRLATDTESRADVSAHPDS